MKKERILITGAKGFVGQAIIKELLAQGAGPENLFITDLKRPNQANYSYCNLSDFDSVRLLINKIRPKKIYHLAGTFSNDFLLDYQSNVILTKNILDSIVKLSYECNILLMGSAAEYGRIDKNCLPVKESLDLNPVSIYGLTKSWQFLLMKTYIQLYDMNIKMARTFNLIGKGISEQLVAGSLYKKINLYKEGKLKEIPLGNLSSKRDFLEVGSAVKYFIKIMDKGQKGEVYNVGSGKSMYISELVEKILREEGVPLEVITSIPTVSNRKIDVDEIFADISKVKSL